VSKAEQVVLRGEVRLIEQYDDILRAVVRSSDSQRVYAVNGYPDGWACTCPAGSYRRLCYHIRAVIGDVERQTRQASLDPQDCSRVRRTGTHDERTS
jgi:uncharacterized Zn finger protein